MKYTGITMGKVVCACDGKSALEQATNDSWNITSSEKQHDLLQLIQQIRKNLPPRINVEPFWVRGHMDDRIPWYHLTRRQQMNVDCDQGAKDCATSLLPQRHHQSVSSGSWEIKHLGCRVVNDIPKKIRLIAHEEPLGELWTTKGHIPPEAMGNIDWECIGSAAKGENKMRTIGIAKMLLDNCATKVNLRRWKASDHE